MRPMLRLPAMLLLAGCVGGALATTASQPSTAPAPDAFECIRRQLKSVGYTQNSYDTESLRVTAHKYDDTARRPDVQFRRLVHRLTFEVSPGTGDALTNITAEAATYAELATHRGPTEEQERTAAEAGAAAKTVLQKCSAPSDSVPGQR